ncbi:hypothetical protein GCM10010219_46770 [Streptomyces netropsis]|nr:hypothetical protein GCM10010219_46770 [Streptomyces netropsis]
MPGWEKCYVLGKEHRRFGGANRSAPDTPAITPERQPLATPSRNLGGQAPPLTTETPLPQGRLMVPPATRWGPITPGRGPVGGRAGGMDRARPIVVHSRPGHKRFVTSE